MKPTSVRANRSAVPLLALASVLVLAARPAAASDPGLKAAEAELQRAFEGKMVTVKLDMPATSMGVDIKPQAPKPMDFNGYSSRIKGNGIALRRGESVMVTKVKVTPKLIEFQLGGGGYGTFADAMSDADLGNGYEGKSTREKNLENDLKSERDPAKRRAISEELDKLRRDRRRSSLGSAAERRQASQLAAANRKEKALSSGSRFNVRYSDGVPSSALTPEGFRRVLAEWVEFEDAGDGEVQASPGSAADRGPAVERAPTGLHKGARLAEIEAEWGAPVDTRTADENGMKLTHNTYKKGGQLLDATFVEGVLVRYSLSEE